jgi:hypothetical protein
VLTASKEQCTLRLISCLLAIALAHQEIPSKGAHYGLYGLICFLTVRPARATQATQPTLGPVAFQQVSHTSLLESQAHMFWSRRSGAPPCCTVVTATEVLRPSAPARGECLRLRYRGYTEFSRAVCCGMLWYTLLPRNQGTKTRSTGTRQWFCGSSCSASQASLRTVDMIRDCVLHPVLVIL